MRASYSKMRQEIYQILLQQWDRAEKCVKSDQKFVIIFPRLVPLFLLVLYSDTESQINVKFLEKWEREKAKLQPASYWCRAWLLQWSRVLAISLAEKRNDSLNSSPSWSYTRRNKWSIASIVIHLLSWEKNLIFKLIKISSFMCKRFQNN